MAKKLTQEEFIQKAKLIHGEKYDYSLVEYKNSITKVKIICKKHGIFEQRAGNHLIKIGCNLCEGGVKLTKETFIIKSKETHKDKYNYDMVDYKGTKTKVKIICNKHGIFEQKPSAHIYGKGCSECAGNKKLTTLSFIEKSKNIHGDLYDYSLVKYNGHKSKVNIICKMHGEFSQTANLHLVGCGCPSCNRSKGEIKIMNFMLKYSLKFKEQHTYKDCRNKLPLPFDFYLPQHNILIEYDGEQHFRPIDYFGGIDDYIKRKNNEKIKNEYAEKNKISLLRISYLEENNIEDLLINFIKNHSISKTYNLDLLSIDKKD